MIHVNHWSKNKDKNKRMKRWFIMLGYHDHHRCSERAMPVARFKERDTYS